MIRVVSCVRTNRDESGFSCEMISTGVREFLPSQGH